MRHKTKINLIAVFMWIGMILIYHVAQYLLELNQLEYREWVNSLYIILFWLIPLLLIGWNLWWQLYCAKEKKKFALIIFAAYCVAGMWVFLSANFVYVLAHNTSETTLDDGNYRICFSTGFLQESEYYYAEPVNVFSRRRFEWTTEKYQESLSKMYRANFQYIGEDDGGNPQFTASEYEDITVTVYGIYNTLENALDDDLRYMVTSSRLEQEWDTYFTHGEECVLHYRDYYSNSTRRHPVYAVVVYRDKIEETAQDLAAFIKNECETAVRADGEPLYENMYGSIFLLFKEDNDSDYVGTRNLPYGEKTNLGIHDASVTVEDVIADLEAGFR